MPDFFVDKVARFRPTHCLTCQAAASVDGFVDTGIELPVYGRVYLCSRCVRQAGARFGMLDTVDADLLRGEVRAAAVLNADLLVELARAEGKGLWTFTPDAEPPAAVGLVCPDCGGAKTATAQRCKPCANRQPGRLAAAAKATA